MRLLMYLALAKAHEPEKMVGWVTEREMCVLVSVWEDVFDDGNLIAELSVCKTHSSF